MVNWYAVCLAAVLFYVAPKRKIANRIRNYWKYRTLFEPPKTIIAILDDIGMNYEKVRFHAKRGARIIIGGQNRTKLEAARRELVRSTKNKNILTIYVNQYDKDSLKKLADEILQSEVGIHAIINNKGKELSDLDIIFITQELARERFENHCLNFLYMGLPNDL